jgi:hypothetical protein
MATNRRTVHKRVNKWGSKVGVTTENNPTQWWEKSSRRIFLLTKETDQPKWTRNELYLFLSMLSQAQKYMSGLALCSTKSAESSNDLLEVKSVV